MNTRRSFLGSLAALLAAPFAWRKKAKADAEEAKQLLSFYRQGILRPVAACPRICHEGVIILPMEDAHKPLRLPPTCKVIGSSPHVRFMTNEFVVKVSDPSLPPTLECHVVPEIKPVYRKDGSFDRWEIIKEGT